MYCLKKKNNFFNYSYKIFLRTLKGKDFTIISTFELVTEGKYLYLGLIIVKHKNKYKEEK